MIARLRLPATSPSASGPKSWLPPPRLHRRSSPTMPLSAESPDGTRWSRNLVALVKRLYGHRAEEVVGRPVALLVPPDRADERERGSAKGLRPRQAYPNPGRETT